MKRIDGTGHRYRLLEDNVVVAGSFPGCTAISGLQDAAGGSGGLTDWAARISLDRYEAVLRESQDWSIAREEADKARNEARDLGSAVHVAIDQFNRGRPLELTAKTSPYVAQYAAWIRNEGIEIVGSEKWVINTAGAFGGTYDALVRMDGALCLMDWKTGKAKASQRLQLTGLSMAELHADKNEEPEPMPAVDKAYIALLQPDGPPELIEHEITDADREHFIRLVKTFHEIRGWAADYMPTVVKEDKAA